MKPSRLHLRRDDAAVSSGWPAPWPGLAAAECSGWASSSTSRAGSESVWVAAPASRRPTASQAAFLCVSDASLHEHWIEYTRQVTEHEAHTHTHGPVTNEERKKYTTTTHETSLSRCSTDATTPIAKRLPFILSFSYATRLRSVTVRAVETLCGTVFKCGSNGRNQKLLGSAAIRETVGTNA